MYVICHCEECKNNKDGYCELDEVCISNNELTAAGFVPLCTDYEEKMRFIDADGIVYESIDSADVAKYETEHGTGFLAVRKEDIDAMLPAEPQIIRCKECINRHLGHGFCPMVHVSIDGKYELYELNQDNDFCSKGALKKR